jgi:ferredoxin--NADP+ reductase
MKTPTQPFRRVPIPDPTLKATAERVTSVFRWSDRLISVRTTRSPAFRFQPGQFARLGIASDHGGTIWRPYSMVSANYDDHLEFFSIIVPDGAFTTRLAHVREGDTIHVEKQSYGYLTTGRFVGGEDLWLLATGTGVAPFISILRDPETWERYATLVLAYSVRDLADLAYREEILAIAGVEPFAAHAAKLHFVPVVTRAEIPGMLNRRLTKLMADGSLENSVGVPLDAARSRILVCGNPQMLDDMRDVLQARGLRPDRGREPGNFACENYW